MRMTPWAGRYRLAVPVSSALRSIEALPACRPLFLWRRRRWLRAQSVKDPEAVLRLWLRPAPRVGQPAPDFRVRSLDGGGSLAPADLVRGGAAVLVFGSFT